MFRDIINFNSIRHVLPVATCAVREAGNRADFLKQVFRETGFNFKVLSDTEEGLYSYVGALRATCIPTALFFDLGGGSVELVYTENYGIKKIKSYPLGALRLSQLFGRGDGTFSKKNYAKMVHHVQQVLTNPKDFDLSPDTILVGVGGTLRAMARYEQEKEDYVLDKIHGYEMDHSAVASVAGELYSMDQEELSKTQAIGTNRVDTITAGSAVIDMLMKTYRFEKLAVSAQGLREGILSVFLQDPLTFYRGTISNEKSKAFVTYACQPEMVPQHTVTLVRPLLTYGMLREKERMILAHAIKQVESLPRVTNLNNLFYLMIDEDSAFLSHREQLILALSIINTRKEKAANWLFSRYRSILEPQNKRSIEKIAACLVLSEILEKGGLNVKFTAKNSKIEMKITPSSARQFIPLTLLAVALKKFEQAFEVSVVCSIAAEKEKVAAI
jgi:exopolyphosphatase/guanosine-5'-triphosphate,3'-diphosphate pyrophosphatase